MDKLNSYKVNKAYTEGVIMHLDDAPEVNFLVKLPGPYNRAYMAAIYGSMEIDLESAEGPEDVKAKINFMEAKEAQEKAFVSHCLVSIDGDPVPDNFLEEYPKAVEELVEKANDAVKRVEARVEDATKKLQPTSTGSIVGVTG